MGCIRVPDGNGSFMALWAPFGHAVRVVIAIKSNIDNILENALVIYSK